MEGQAAYRALEAQHLMPLFDRPWWLGVTAGSEHWDAVLCKNAEGQTTGAWAFGIKKQLGFQRIFLPPYTPYLGPQIFYPENISEYEKRSFEHKTLESLIGLLPKARDVRFKWKPGYDNWLPFYWAGYEQSTRYTYLHKNIGTHVQEWYHLKNSVRRQIKKAEQQLEVINSHKGTEVIRLFEQSLANRELDYPVDKPLLENLHREITLHKCGCVLEAHADKKVIAAICLVWDHQQMYYLYGGYDQKYSDSGAKTLLFWHAILKAGEMDLNFNFEGSMIPGVERFFRSFGGQLTPVFFLSKRQFPFHWIGI